MGPVLGPHARTNRTRETRDAEPRLPAPEDGRPGEGQRLTPGAPHNGGKHPPGDALPPPPQRATPARKGARRGAGAGSPRPHQPHPGHTGRGAQAARSRGRAARGGTAPDTGRPSQRWQATPPGTAPHHPRGTQPPQGMQAKGTLLGPHSHTPPPTASGWRTPTARPMGGQSGEGQRRPQTPLTMVEGTPPGDALPPPPQRATPARKSACCGAGAGSPRPQRPHPGHTGRGTLAARSRGRAAGGGTAPDTRRPSQRWKAPPPGTPLRHPRSEQRQPARAHAVGPVLGPHARTDRTRDTRDAEPWLPAPDGGRPGEGQRLTPGAPHNGGTPAPPGTAPHHPRGIQPSQGKQAKGTVLGPQAHTHAPTALGWRTPTARPMGGQSGGGQRLTPDAPHNGGRHPPRGYPSATPTSQVGANRDRTAPPQARQTERGTGAGHAEGHGPGGTALPAPSAGTTRGAHATPGRQGGGADTARAREHTHGRDTRGLPERQPDRARGTHRPRGMVYQRARVRDTRTGRPATRSAEHAGRGGGNERDTTPGTGPNPPNRLRAPRTHRRGTAPAKAVVAHSATPQPLG